MTDVSMGARALSESLSTAEELRRIHRLVTEHDLDIPLRDDFFDQCIAAEAALGSSRDFASGYRRMKRRNALSGWLAVPILLLAVALWLAGKFGFDGDYFAFLMGNPWILVIAGVLFVAVIALAIAFVAAKRRLMRTLYPGLLERIAAAC